MEAGRLGDRAYDLIDVMVKGADKGFFGRRFVEARTRRLSDLRFVLRYVYRQLDELSDRGAGALAAR